MPTEVRVDQTPPGLSGHGKRPDAYPKSLTTENGVVTKKVTTLYSFVRNFENFFFISIAYRISVTPLVNSKIITYLLY